mgnify:CR=1 FL=1|tara:strand:+ start:690 stop:962 length:273 start_codon:yes stop_codon:yes gene_type:complete
MPIDNNVIYSYFYAGESDYGSSTGVILVENNISFDFDVFVQNVIASNSEDNLGTVLVLDYFKTNYPIEESIFDVSKSQEQYHFAYHVNWS